MAVIRTVELDIVQPAAGTLAATYGHGTRAHGTLRRRAHNPEATDTIRYSDCGYVDESGTPYPPYVTDAFTLDRGLTLTADAMGGALSAGSITLANPDGLLDSLLTTRVNDHLPVRIHTGSKIWDGVRQVWKDPASTSLRPVFAGLGKSWRPDRTSVAIDLLDATYWLEGSMPVSVYGGAGKLDGDSNVAGKGMPRIRGSVCNITPVLIDSVNYVYQISDGPAAITALYEGGYPGGIASAGTVADIYAASPSPGTYTVQTGSAGTWLRLGTKPVYGITVDAVGKFRSGAAPANVLDILRQMLLEDLVMPAAYLDAAWPATSSIAPWPGGWYWDGSETITGKQAVSTLLSGLCITLVPTRTGTLLPILLTAPDPAETPAAELNADLITEIAAATLDSSLDPPTWRWRIGWQHNFTVQTTGSNLHPQAPAARQAIIAVADRAAIWWSPDIKSRWRVPNDPALVTTALARQTDATTIAKLHGALWGTQRRLWAVTIPQDLAWGIDLGDVIGISAPAPGLEDRQLARVVSEHMQATDQTVTFQILV
ncbi:hypothetical protein [Acetobacter senegalensis]|uniref:hypothetical protein n=1 Tax=Acetobacter senegalensis TaxID=446692 RepID=UPI001ED9C910|nr:hypothetical protein [Acetobacter senegalensis]MCG4255612.1 hypothetical protein [Acetobacter senegalensis]MCG4265519.1 hypothetical protein [Acetobacter senegalensis]